MINKKDIEQNICKALENLKKNPSFSGFRTTKLLELIGLLKGEEKLNQILNNKTLISAFANANGLTPPIYVYDFIYNFSRLLNPKSHLDPWLTPSSPSNFFDFGTTTVFGFNQTTFEELKTISENSNSTFICGDNWDLLDKTKDTFEFITCFPPLGMRSEKKEIGGLKTSNDFSTSLLIKASTLLTENGKSIFLMPLSFLTSENNKALLRKLGLFVDAVFSLPAGTLQPYTNIPTNLIILTKQVNEKTFVAEIASDEKTNKIILDNYSKRKESKEIKFGRYVNIPNFESLQKLIAEKEEMELVKRIGYKPVPLTDVTLNINLIKALNKDDVEHLYNSFYLPKIGNSSAVTLPSEMKMKNPRNYFQIQLDETKANSTFTAKYFNSNIGMKLRERLEVGGIIPSISKISLQNCNVYLPDLNTQMQTVEIDSKIQQLNLRLEELKRNLWKRPKSFKSISKELKNINKEENLEHWIDTLPFPISSILWRYYATNETSKKIEHLFHFFEALSEFFSMIMLSSLVQNPEFYKRECHNWIDKDDRFKEWYFKATFGSWNILTSRLSKSVRKYYTDSDDNNKNFCKSLFGYPSESFMKMLTEKGIVNILFAVAELRNKWKGHGGITNEEEDKQRVIELEQQLNEIRKFIADGFDEAKIISAKKGELDEGVWTFTAKELVGAKSPFKEIEIISLDGLDKKKLYLTHSNQTKHVQLLPFIKYIEINDAVYFYTSIESMNVRWISYHFEKDPELNQPAENELFKTFEFLKQNI